MAAPREIRERADEVAAEAPDIRLAQAAIGAEIEVGERGASMVPGIDESSPVLLGPSDLVIDVLESADVDGVMGQLLDQDRGQADDDPVWDAGFAKVLSQHEQRQICAEHGFVDPLLAVRPTARAAAVRQM